MDELKKSSDKINKFIIDFIGRETKKNTPVDIVECLKKNFNIRRRESKKYLKHLISNGDLEYTNFFGRTFVEISFSKPVRISERILLTPPVVSYVKEKNDVVVILEKGISFGRGTHPTTRLCLQGIDFVLGDKTRLVDYSNALDIGTGSGVLVIAGVLLGVNSAHACDLDSISLSEAKNNIKKNNLVDKISVGESFDINKKYNYIFANLRFPTLIDLYETLIKITEKNSYLFLSGIKIEEIEKIKKKYLGLDFNKVWEQSEAGWVGIVFIRI